MFLPQPCELCDSAFCLTMSSADARAAELVVRYNALIESLRAVHRMLRRGRVSRGIQMLEEALDGVLSDASESDEPAEPEPVQDITLADVQAALLAQMLQSFAAPVQAFSGRCFRLDGSAVETSSAAASDGDAPASEDSQEPHCRRCGDRTSLHVMDQSGPWLDAASEAERTYCSDCLYG